MANFNNLGNSQEHFTNQKILRDFLTDAREYNIGVKNNKSFVCWHRLGGDRKGVRLATWKKRPQYPRGSDWPTIEETRTIEELVKKYGEHGERTGTKRGKLIFEVWDLDITHQSQNLPTWLQNRLRKNFELIAKIYRFSYVETQHGYQVYLLLDELSANFEIFHRDSWQGIKRNVGSILSQGRQVQGASSQFKKWVNNGTWFWKLKNVEQLAEILKKFFFEIVVNKGQAEKKININIKSDEFNLVNPIPKTKEITGENKYKIIKLEEVKIISKQATQKTNYYRVNYLNKFQESGFFFMDSYFRDKKELIQPNLITNLLLMRGYKYQFYLKTY